MKQLSSLAKLTKTVFFCQYWHSECYKKMDYEQSPLSKICEHHRRDRIIETNIKSPPNRTPRRCMYSPTINQTRLKRTRKQKTKLSKWSFKRTVVLRRSSCFSILSASCSLHQIPLSNISLTWLLLNRQNIDWPKTKYWWMWTLNLWKTKLNIIFLFQ